MKSVLLIIWGLSMMVFSHGGRTNSEGCHNNRKTGEYHCHGAQSKSKNSVNSSRQSRDKLRPVANRTFNNNSIKLNDALIDKDTLGASEAVVCCKVCKKGKACGNTCIAKWKSCHKGSGCACDG